MRTEVIERGKIRIVVGEATVAMGLRRQQLRTAALLEDEPDFERRVLRQLTWPDLLAATVEVSGLAWPMSFEQFLKLDDELAAAWEEAVYRLNPHWTAHRETPADDIIRRLTDRWRARKEAEDSPPELPDDVDLTDAETALQVFQLLELTGWRWPPHVLLRQPEALLTDILIIADLNARIERLLQPQHRSEH